MRQERSPIQLMDMMPKANLPVQAVDAHGAGQDETAEEQENRRLGERGQNRLGIGHSGQDAQDGPQHGADRDGDRFADPPDDDPGDDGGQGMGLRADPGHGQEPHGQAQQRSQEKAPPLAPGFHLLLEAAKSLPPAQQAGHSGSLHFRICSSWDSASPQK